MVTYLRISVVGSATGIGSSAIRVVC